MAHFCSFLRHFIECHTVCSGKVLLLYNTNTYVTADVVSTFAYRQGLGTGAGTGVAAAAEMMNNVIGMLLVIGANTIARKASNTSLY